MNTASNITLIESEQTSPDLGQLLAVLRRRGLWILLCVVVVSGVAYGYSKHKVKQYSATAALAFSDNQLDQQIAGLPTTTSNLAQQDSNLELVRLGDMAAKTASLLGHGLTAESVVESLSIGGRGESSIVGVSATSNSPILAAAIANTYVAQFVREQQAANRHFLNSALSLVNKQLARLSPAQRFGTDGLDLEERAQTLRLLAELHYNNVEVAQEASVPSSPSSPKVSRNTILGAILGFLLGLGVAFLRERSDLRIRRPEDLEEIYGLPMLGTVPNSAALARSTARDRGKVVELPAAEAEAFSLIRAHLRFFNVDRDLRTVVIGSPAPNDGKTTIARRLAEAAARSGSRVLLLEVDLRHPTLGQQLGIQSGQGLAGVLIGAISVDEAIQSVGLEGPLGEGTSDRRFDVLVAGAVLPPNPGELLESRAMDTLLARARSEYDLVVIDTPPLTVVSDAFPLLTKVDGVIIVGWVRHSRRDTAEQLQRTLASRNSGAPLLGVIANGSKAGAVGSYVDSANSKSVPGDASDNGASSSRSLAQTVEN
jgi:polysaccharide biosynthesis transport protein